MLIRVIYKDGRFDLVKPQMLDKLLEEHKVTSFMRSTGWAIVGRDPIRRGRYGGYWGEEQRTV